MGHQRAESRRGSWPRRAGCPGGGRTGNWDGQARRWPAENVRPANWFMRAPLAAKRWPPAWRQGTGRMIGVIGHLLDAKPPAWGGCRVVGGLVRWALGVGCRRCSRQFGRLAVCPVTQSDSLRGCSLGQRRRSLALSLISWPRQALLAQRRLGEALGLPAVGARRIGPGADVPQLERRACALTNARAYSRFRPSLTRRT